MSKETLNVGDGKDEYVTRLAKLQTIVDGGIVAYPSRFERTHNAVEVADFAEKATLRSADEVFANPTKNIRVGGRIMTFREHGKIAFANIQDASGQLQICFKFEVLGEKVFKFLLDDVDLGDFVGIVGEPFMTKQNKLAVLCAEFVFLGKALRPLPDKFHGLEDTEIKYRKRYLDLIANRETTDRFLTRSKITEGLRTWLISRGFTEIVTRTLQMQAGGALAKPFTTHHNTLDTDYALRIAPELDLKMAIVGGFEKVFEFAMSFRNEGMDPSHLQEFQMLEWYAAYENMDTNMQWTQELLQEILPKTLGKSSFIVFDKKGKEYIVDISKPFKKVTFKDLLAEVDVDIFAEKDVLVKKAIDIGIDATEAKSRSRANLLDDIYKKLVRPNLVDPTFVTHHPGDLKPLARRNDADPRLADSFQLLIAGWEIVNAYSELVDPIAQRKLLEEQAKERKSGDAEAMEVNEEYLTAMEHGMPPITGFGMGVDRLVALVTGQKNLRDVVLFPLMKKEDSGKDGFGKEDSDA
jgi:lysyl-tRNA synthetase class 2